MSPDRTRPLVIGLTGGIGSGKSHVRQTLTSLGAEGIDADREAQAAIAAGGPAHAAVVAGFGRAILAPDGSIDRPALAARVFSDAAALARLEALVHPAVIRSVQARVAASAAPAVVIEAIKLLEAGLGRSLCDRIWVTVCSRRQQLARLRASRGMTAAEARLRMASQMPTAAMAGQADLVIDTGGTLAATKLTVLAAWHALGLPWPPPVVRPGRPEDAEGVAALCNAAARAAGAGPDSPSATPAGERRRLAHLPPGARWLVGCLGQVVAGFRLLAPCTEPGLAPDHVALVDGCVAGAARGTELERRLGLAALDAARDAGYRKVVALVEAGDGDGEAAYAGLGFRRSTRLPGQAPGEEHRAARLVLELQLDRHAAGTA